MKDIKIGIIEDIETDGMTLELGIEIDGIEDDTYNMSIISNYFNIFLLFKVYMFGKFFLHRQ